jgi:8-oxo-dGTP pyrophosphatase MutT (NUDIX family)
MGAGILPTTIHKNKLFFLFGKENKYEDTAPGFSDFGGGTDNKETYMETAIREGCEELTGFLGSEQDVKKMLERNGTYNIDNKTPGGSIYRIHVFPMIYDDKLPFYYNNNQRFLQKRLDPEVIQKSKIFEKEEIRWISIDEIMKMKSQFRFFFKPILDRIYREKEEIKKFVAKGLRLKPGSSRLLKRKTQHNKTQKRRMK